MAQSLEDYLSKFTQLRQGNISNRSSSRFKKYPYKPLLLLTIIDMIEDGTITQNHIDIPSLNPELRNLFSGYWSHFFQDAANIYEPFTRLVSEGFWHLVPKDGGGPPEIEYPSDAQLEKKTVGARLDRELFRLLTNKPSRDRLRRILIKHYFPQDTWSTLDRQSEIHVGSQNYAWWLIEKAKGSTSEDPPTREVPIREAGFRRAIVSIYEHQCAFCRLSIRSPEDHTVVQAAHIIPWSEGRDDDLGNGLALCGVCHWTFDEGLLSLSNDWHILFSSHLEKEGQQIGYLQTLKGTQILLPHKSLRPQRESLEWHRTKTFIDAM